MTLLELFSGTKSATKVARAMGIPTVTLDNNPKCDPDYCMDVLDVDAAFLRRLERKHGKITMLWASPECKAYSSLRRNWQALNHHPPDLDHADKLVRKTLWIIDHLSGLERFWIENPFTGELKRRGILDHLTSAKCSYCKYSTGEDTFMTNKKTLIWGSVRGWSPRRCNAAEGFCAYKAAHGKHAEALGNSFQGSPEVKRKDRGRIPPLLIRELFDHGQQP